MKMKIWGSRGSLPAPYTPEQVEKKVRSSLHRFFETGHTSSDQIDDFLKSLPIPEFGGYGGNTLCVEVTTPTTRLIIDGGSGLRLLGYDLMKGPCGKGKGEVHILFTHFHWDHVSGLPFFVPLFIPGNTVHVYAVQYELEEMFEMLFHKPFFPVELQDIGAKIIYHKLEMHGQYRTGDLTFSPFRLDHPDPCYGYRIEHEGKAYAHCVDTEAKRVTPETLCRDTAYYKNLDLMLFDAQYTTREKYEKIDWGHASATVGLDIAMNSGIKRVVFTHHDPSSVDEKIYEYEQEAREYYEMSLKMAKSAKRELHEVEWCFAYDGMEIDV